MQWRVSEMLKAERTAHDMCVYIYYGFHRESRLIIGAKRGSESTYQKSYRFLK